MHNWANAAQAQGDGLRVVAARPAAAPPPAAVPPPAQLPPAAAAALVTAPNAQPAAAGAVVPPPPAAAEAAEVAAAAVSAPSAPSAPSPQPPFPPAFSYNASQLAALSAPPPPPYPPGESVLIALRSGHFFGDYARVVPDCDVRCEFRNQGSEGADALWYHAPSACGGAPDRAFPGQLAITMSMESAANYRCLDDPGYMKGFDIEMTYRLASPIPVPYLHREHVEDFARPTVPFDEKRDEIIYIQSNCAASTGRDDILRRVSQLGVGLHARGACLNNQPSLPRSVGKKDTMKLYKICATMENSRGVDYVTEKLWDGLSAGCLPIYYGAPNIAEHLPSPEAVINYEELGGTPEALAAEVKRLIGDKAAYEYKMAWRTRPLAQLGQGYQRLVVRARWPKSLLCVFPAFPPRFPPMPPARSPPPPPLQADAYLEHSQCRLCKLVATMRAQRVAAGTWRT